MEGEYDGKCDGLGVGLAVNGEASTHFFFLHINPGQHDSRAFFQVEPHSFEAKLRPAHFGYVGYAGLVVGGTSTHFVPLHVKPEQHDSRAFFHLAPHSFAARLRAAHCVYVGLGVGEAFGALTHFFFFRSHLNPKQHDSGAFFKDEPHSCAGMLRPEHVGGLVEG